MLNEIKYLYPSAVLGADFTLQDDGAGPYIKSWNAAKLGAQPTQAQLAATQPAADLQAARPAAITKIDADVDAIYLAMMGERATEYSLAESDANAYKTAAYPVTPVPVSVQAWASAKALTTTWAANDILATATNWRTVQGNIRTNRLAKKEAVRAATAQAGIDTAMTAWAAFVATTRTQLGI